ncbi:MAG: hypothetical protein NTW29_04655 [Bacteroidetes bacterium]|nr:hypothetical protein [Bacteroidota bacterium]
MIRKEHQTLWNGIRLFAIDEPGAAVKYSDKLRQSSHWTPAYTSRVIEEYRKFIFLCMVLPRGASPSQAVDEAWHMHLTYTVNYWDGLCANILGKPLHHHPSRGGPEEKHKHTDWYQETLEGYQYYFGEQPPRDIWPPPVLQKPDTDQKPDKKIKLYYLFFLLPFLFPLFFDRLHPFELKGPHFIIFLVLLMACIAIALSLHYANRLKNLRSQFEAIDTSSLNIFQFTRTIFGRNRMVQTATIDLIAKGVLVPVENNRFRIEAYDKTEIGKSNPTIPFLERHYTNGETVNLTDLEFMCNQEKVLDEHFEQQVDPLRKRDVLATVVMILLLIICLARMIQGLLNAYPISILMILLVIAFIAAVRVIRGFSGWAMLQQLVTNKYMERSVSLADRLSAPNANDFAFLGITAIAGMYGAEHLTNSFRNHFGSASGTSGSGCGSSGCGSSCGSGDGGGCGGGCGGCGG